MVYLKKFIAGIAFALIVGLLIYFIPKIHLPEYDKCKSTHLKFDYSIGEAIIATSIGKSKQSDDLNFKASQEVLSNPICYSQSMIENAQYIYDDYLANQ